MDTGTHEDRHLSIYTASSHMAVQLVGIAYHKVEDIVAVGTYSEALQRVGEVDVVLVLPDTEKERTQFE